MGGKSKWEKGGDLGFFFSVSKYSQKGGRILSLTDFTPKFIVTCRSSRLQFYGLEFCRSVSFVTTSQMRHLLLNEKLSVFQKYFQA